MKFFDNVKKLFQKKPKKESEPLNYRVISLDEIRKKFDEDDINNAARDLKTLLDLYGKRINKKHRYKGREFIDFILGSKHKDLKNVGYLHWQNVVQIIEANRPKVYPYYKQKLKEAIDFFSKEIRDINNLSFTI